MDDLFGLGLAAGAFGGLAPGRRIDRGAGLDLEPDLALQRLGERGLELLARGRPCTGAMTAECWRLRAKTGC